MHVYTHNKSIKHRLDPDPVSEDTQNSMAKPNPAGYVFGLVVNLQIALDGVQCKHGPTFQ